MSLHYHPCNAKACEPSGKSVAELVAEERERIVKEAFRQSNRHNDIGAKRALDDFARWVRGDEEYVFWPRQDLKEK